MSGSIHAVWGVITPELTTEERIEMRTALIGENAQNALDFQNRAVRKFGPAAGIFIRQLVFWDGNRSAAGDGWLYKSRSEMQEETGLNQKQQQKARRGLVAAGVLEEEERPVGPLKRRTMHYRPNLANLMEILHPDDSAPQPVEPEAERVEPEPDGYEPDLVPLLTDEDAPEEDAPTDWLPADFPPAMTDAETPLNPYMKPYSESRTRNPIANQVHEPLKGITYMNPYSDSGIQESTFTRERPRENVTHSVESFVTTQDSTGESSLALLPPGEDEVNNEVKDTTTPPLDDLDAHARRIPDAKGTEDHKGRGKPPFEELMRAVLSGEELERLTGGRLTATEGRAT